jgi:asparagine synthase (glutamine-hydrolysing)
MTVGFSVIGRHQEVVFHLYPQGDGNRSALVTWCQTRAYVAILMGRLYYRCELLADLHSQKPALLPSDCEVSDAMLALAAYRAWGRDGIARLEGDFALVIWDAQSSQLVASRDPLGGYPLFWMQSHGVTAFSTSPRPLLTLLSRQSLNLDYVAEFVLLPDIGVQELGGDSCIFEGLHRLPAGTIASGRVPDGRLEQHPFWNWQERLVDPGTDRLEAMSAQYGDLLRHAVRERLRGPTASHLSGGMDSTAVALLAQHLMCSGSGTPPLHTLSLVYERLAGLARETPYIESALQQQRGIVAHRIAADDLLDFDIFADPPPHDEPWPGLVRMGAERALVDMAAQMDMTTLLTGVGADEMLDVPPFYIAELLRQGRLCMAWQEASRWAAAYTSNVWTMLYSYGVTHALPAWACAGLEPVLRRGYASWQHQNSYTIAPWILPSFARRHALRSRALENIQRTYALCQPVGLSVLIAAISSRYGDLSRRYLAAPRGVHLTHPFLDPRVLCFALGMHTRFRAEPGRKKPVLAEAMRGVLPDQIRNRRLKGHFNEVYYLGLARNLPIVERMIGRAPIDDLGLFNKDILVRCLHQAALGVASGVRALDRLNLTLSLIQWLCLQTEAVGPAGPPVEVIHADGQGKNEDQPSTQKILPPLEVNA